MSNYPCVYNKLYKTGSKINTPYEVAAVYQYRGRQLGEFCFRPKWLYP